jgi:radical SAM superfamily enzyme YgiQ (UPF0313 family)
MTKLTFCNASWRKEDTLRVLLYSPLAMAYLARHTPKHYRIDFYDEYVGEDIDPETVDSDIVAVTSITPSIPRAYEIADKLKKRGITTVLGGAHASALPDEALEHFDSVVIGEGEGPWKRLLEDFERGNIQRKYACQDSTSLKNLGTPDRRFIHPNYHFQSVTTSRGCPFRCSFCYQTINNDRKYRIIPHDTVLEDLDSLRKEKALTVTDANFIGYSKRDIEDRKILLEKIIRKGYKFIWGCQTTVNLADDPELMKLMYKAGCRVVFVGFESSNEDSLKEMNKNQNMNRNYKEIVKQIHKHKIAVIASCIFGMDSHKKDYHKSLIRELKEMKPDFIDITYLTAFPGTPLFDKLEKEGRVETNWNRLRLKTPSIKFKHYTHEEILKARKEIADAFFTLPNIIKIIFRLLFRMESNTFKLFSKIRLFLKMVERDKIAEKTRFARDRKIFLNKDLY